MENENKAERSWYERVFETTDLTSSNPKVEPYVNVDKYPEWVVNVMAELSRQSLHLSPVKELARITPKRLGLNLGQKCANLYAISNQFQPATENPKISANAELVLKQFQEQKENPAAASTLHAIQVTRDLLSELANEVEEFEKIVHNAFKEALDQSNHTEAVLFFQGFARGLASPGLLPGRLAQATDATPIYLKMFYHWQEVDRLPNVTTLHEYLLKVGISKSMLGDIDRLRTLCKRIKYAPGKRGRPSKIRK